MNYRKDIDGLRALAVVPVVLYHAGFGLFSGGYVGVDVFFVISGYLITGIIGEEIRQQRFSVLHFYERRIRRIFPALFVVLLFTMIAGLLLLLPEDLVAMSKSLVAATLFSSNILFWRESGYFDTAAELKPLLHTWSLAVEEQFYIFFPLFLLVAWRWMKNRWQAATWACLIASFALSVYGLRYHDEATFYLLPTRAWELLMGSVIALGAVPTLPNQKWREALAALGIGLILYAVFAYSQATPFPGEYALAPCLGAALIIYAGRDAAEPTWTARILSLQPVVFIGLISYSLYLWHWPLIVYAKYIAIFPLTTWQSVAIVAASVGLAILSWRYVEAPFRKGNGTFFTRNRTRLFASSGVIMAGAIAISLSAIILHGLPMRMDPKAIEIMAEAKAGQKLTKGCMSSRKDSHFKKPEDSCSFGPDKASPDIVLWGDSHASALLPALIKATQGTNHNIRTLLMSACPPVVGINLRETILETCRHFNESAIKFIQGSAAKTIVVTGRWGTMLKGEHNKNIPRIAQRPGTTMTYAEAKIFLDVQLRQTIEALVKTKKQIYLVYATPESSNDIPSTLARLLNYKSKEELRNLFIQQSESSSNGSDIKSLMDGLPSAPNFHRINPANILCETGRCSVMKNEKALYYDQHHLSKTGAEMLAPLFEPLLNQSAN